MDGVNASPNVIETPLLVVGSGPAGASLACFLSHPPYSMTGIIISAASTTAQLPRAHITNPAMLECLRDIGLEQEALERGERGDTNMLHTRWCHDMTGEEFSRNYAWGNDPKRRKETYEASPCMHCDLPQTVCEPILTQRAMFDGWDLRFKTTFITFKKEADGRLLSTVRDLLTGMEYFIRSKYLFGADGTRTQVLRELKIPLIKKPSQGMAYNVLVRADLSDYIDARKGNLHWFFQPEKEYMDNMITANMRMVKPWHEWMFILFGKRGAEWQEPTLEQCYKRIREFIGNDDLPVEILDRSKWTINEIVAEYYSEGNVFCLGDAVHRHPPANGLGSNTCVQDAFNLAWKIKFVEQGFASPKLLESFSRERQPVGAGVVQHANSGARMRNILWDEFGILEPTVEERVKKFTGLREATPEGRKRRQRLMAAMDYSAHANNSIGIEMNHRYESDAVYLADEIEAGRTKPEWPEDAVLNHLISSYPGHRLPHVWLNRPVPEKKYTSTIDLAGHGKFSLFTGIGGDKWVEAARSVGTELGLDIQAHTIGWGQQWVDVYRDWELRREVEEDGCILARPDRFVAWRSFTLVEDCAEKLRNVLTSILGR
ncbi:2,4-dichlorophenol 6-monooxygenase [Leptodontidium sp. MPI-SDFR-AT-0119]|nr:2,4-dichlorophenol 6-monooxygenase [Leptodontidium sp. MPI-SDFR-AT-0119]